MKVSVVTCGNGDNVEFHITSCSPGHKFRHIESRFSITYLKLYPLQPIKIFLGVSDNADLMVIMVCVNPCCCVASVDKRPQHFILNP